MLSLNAVDQIVKWREQILFAYTAMRIEQTVQFMWESENYLRKMQHDTSFLPSSNYSKYFNFSSKSDPFMVLPSTQSIQTNKKQQVRKLTVPLDNYLMKRIRASELVLMGEAVLTIPTRN